MIFLPLRKNSFLEASHQYNALLKAFHGGQEWKSLPYDVIHIGRAHLIIWIHYTLYNIQVLQGLKGGNPFLPQILIIRRLPMFAQKSPLANPSTIRSRVCSSSNWSIAAWIEIFILDSPCEVLYMDSHLAVVAGHVGVLRGGTHGSAHPLGL